MTTKDRPTNSDDVIDSRDVIEAIEALEGERDGEFSPEDWAEDNPEDAAELAALVALRDEASGYAADWQYGETLIRDSYFQDYAQQLADDVGMIPDDTRWPLTCIDWKQAARELQQDYTQVDFGGVAYWVR